MRTAAVCLVVNPMSATYLVTIPIEPHKTEAINTNNGANFFIGIPFRYIANKLQAFL